MGVPNPKAMTESSQVESAGKFEGSRANVVLTPCFFLCACTHMPFSTVFSYSIVLVFSCCTVQFFSASSAQWNSWLPKPKEKEKGKGKNKGGKGDLNGKGKGHVNEMLNFADSSLGQSQDSWSLCTYCLI